MPDSGFQWRNKAQSLLGQIPLLILSAIFGAILSLVLEILIGTILAVTALEVSRALTPPVGPNQTGFVDESAMLAFLPAYFFIPTAALPGACSAFLFVGLRTQRRLKWFVPAVAGIGQILGIFYKFYGAQLPTYWEPLPGVGAAVFLPIMLGLYASVMIVRRVLEAK